MFGTGAQSSPSKRSQRDKYSLHAGEQSHSATSAASMEAALQGADCEYLCGTPPRAESAALAGTGAVSSCPTSFIAHASKKPGKAGTPIWIGQLPRPSNNVRAVECCALSSKIKSKQPIVMQGPLDLYRGLTCAILGTIPVAMIYFSTYELSKGFMERRGASGTTSHLASASMGALMSAFVRVPTDTLRHQTQAYLIPNFVQVDFSEAPGKLTSQMNIKLPSVLKVGMDGHASLMCKRMVQRSQGQCSRSTMRLPQTCPVFLCQPISSVYWHGSHDGKSTAALMYFL